MSSTDAMGDFNEHLKTYKGFLNLLTYSAAGTVALLVILFFSLAR
ncbi:aa3-type cytochrome c oxidase subunit IV [Methylocystis heyeri]|uniref:Aa3-type cytochrome c oxidase subunit IV n=1 Tax=Methylocystis heyeri TaxID=391905 RepID=A0A6B8KG29_9HYPH|nr:aa3-type cytochrome c oxidase subunit IV [Methylocystis heyeri]QGM46572.1 aa3-type cytochrome c oxidase subunit IV [Methylocystis heyeri]